MTTEPINRELAALSQAVHRLGKALERGDYHEAIAAYDAAKAYNENLGGELGRLAALIGTRDLTAELSESLRMVRGEDDAA